MYVAQHFLKKYLLQNDYFEKCINKNAISINICVLCSPFTQNVIEKKILKFTEVLESAKT